MGWNILNTTKIRTDDLTLQQMEIASPANSKKHVGEESA